MEYFLRLSKVINIIQQIQHLQSLFEKKQNFAKDNVPLRKRRLILLTYHYYLSVTLIMLKLNQQPNPNDPRANRSLPEGRSMEPTPRQMQNNVFPLQLEKVDYNSNYTNHYINHEAAPANKVTRYDLINKNYIFPQDTFKGESNYTGTYKNNSDSRVKTEKVNYPDNEILPKGKFQGNSSYLENYINSQGTKTNPVKHEGELHVGGKFEGSSNYADNYLDRSAERQSKKLFKPEGQLKIGGQFYGQSNYANNYYDKGFQGRNQKFVPQPNQVLPEGKFNTEGTTYGNNYTINPIQKSQQIRPEPQIVLGTNKFEAVSSYGAEYIKKEGGGTASRSSPPQNFILPKGNFVGNSTYGDNYVPGTIQRNEQFRPEGELKVGGKFEGYSSYASDYDQRNKMNGRREKVQFHQNQILPKGNFQGDSTYQRNYTSNQKPIPSKIVKHPEELKVGGQFYGSSNYAASYEDRGLIGRQEKAIMPTNKIFTDGKFQDYTTYTGNYVQNPLQRNIQYRPEGQLKVNGGVFNANSSYESDYIKKEGQSRQRIITQQANEVLPHGKFVGNSTYGDNYIQNQNRIVRREQFHPEQNLKVGGQFEGNSNYAENYDGGSSPPRYLNKQNEYDIKSRQK